MNRVQAVVFDMDGVLVESEDIWLAARTEFATSIGQVWTAEDQTATMGCNTAAWSRFMVQRLGLKSRLGMDEAGVAHEIIRRMQAKYAAHLPQRAGAVHAVRTAAAHYRVALASGSPRALGEAVLRATGLDEVLPAQARLPPPVRRAGTHRRGAGRRGGGGRFRQRHPLLARRGHGRHRGAEPGVPAGGRCARQGGGLDRQPGRLQRGLGRTGRCSAPRLNRAHQLSAGSQARSACSAGRSSSMQSKALTKSAGRSCPTGGSAPPASRRPRNATGPRPAATARTARCWRAG